MNEQCACPSLPTVIIFRSVFLLDRDPLDHTDSYPAPYAQSPEQWLASYLPFELNPISLGGPVDLVTNAIIHRSCSGKKERLKPKTPKSWTRFLQFSFIMKCPQIIIP